LKYEKPIPLCYQERLVGWFPRETFWSRLAELSALFNPAWHLCVKPDFQCTPSQTVALFSLLLKQAHRSSAGQIRTAVAAENLQNSFGISPSYFPPLEELMPSDKSSAFADRNSFFSATQGINRRDFIRTAAICTTGALLGGAEDFLQAKTRGLPKPNKSGIEHIVLVTMENRSFDHFLGWLGSANGMQAGLAFADSAGNTQLTFALTDFQGCGHADPDHSYAGGRIQYDSGKCDGFLQTAPVGDTFPIGYYTQSDLAFLGQAAPGWTTFSGYFAAIMAETFPNRIYQHAGQTDRIDNSPSISTLPTIWDRLAEHSISRRYYFSDIPLLALWGSKYLSISAPIANFFVDCAAGTLPHVAFVEPRFLGESQGLSSDDHPFADIRNGEAFLNSVYSANHN